VKISSVRAITMLACATEPWRKGHGCRCPERIPALAYGLVKISGLVG